ncbi:NAD(P)-dependent oxidoreductase [Methylibium rhizosphaerae]|uniref:NAD(P)-dependent oxidoreductase n=1 Tax=Methylibium rhizosphaerae TaxID=2570323 RepID=UPI001FE7D4E8|nr:NAD(P)-dependent oxidoreductase [Methylibium rhizosphaerae]
MKKITLLGTGLMGAPMARRLCQAGFDVTVWNRTRAKAEALASHGARVADSAPAAVAQADAVVTLLEHGGVVHEVLFGLGTASALPRGALVVDMSSIKPREAREHAQALQARGVAHLDAPVSGGTVGAEAGTLAIMAGGDAADFARAAPVFAAFGRATHVGPHGAGQLAKLANQMIVGITIGAVAEALLLAARGGADMAQVRNAIRGGFAESRILEVHGQRMVERDFAKRGAMTVQLKDLRNALDTAEELGFEAPVTELFARLYSEAIDHGLGQLDHSALFAELARRNGLD